jgi:dUTP pyrophosphatase
MPFDSNQLPSIRIKKLHADARLPQRGTVFSAGADLSCLESFTLEPGQRKLVSTGLAIEIPPGFYGRVAPRSGLAVRHGIDVLAGVIDSDFRAEVKVPLINFGQDPVSINAGERIAQLIIEQAAMCDYVWAEELNDTERGEGGFGSTGR